MAMKRKVSRMITTERGGGGVRMMSCMAVVA